MNTNSNEAIGMLLGVLDDAGLPIDTRTFDNVRRVAEADLAGVVASWVDLAHPEARKAWAEGQR